MKDKTNRAVYFRGLAIGALFVIYGRRHKKINKTQSKDTQTGIVCDREPCQVVARCDA